MAAETCHPRPGKGPADHIRAEMTPQPVDAEAAAMEAQAASAPDAFATWVAIASIKAGERQS